MESRPSIGEAADRIQKTCSLGDEVSCLRYVTENRAEALGRLGISRVSDLLVHIPHRYLDFSSETSIAYTTIGTDVTIRAKVEKITVKHPRPRMSIVEVEAADATGVMTAVFFRQPWVAQQLHEGDEVAFSGTMTFAYGFHQMKAPFFEVITTESEKMKSHAKILPVHPATEGISPAWMRRIISSALADQGDVLDWLPARLVASRGFMTLARALREVHFPSSMAAAEKARRRLAYDELLCLQMALLARRTFECEGDTPFVHTIDGSKKRALLAALPFELTEEQKIAAHDILHDMATPEIMNRLLLGDVGTGKTVVAALALAAVADSGTQAAMMAPTSVLAKQYAEKIGPLLTAADISWALVTGSTPAAERTVIENRLATGATSVIFGTSALLSEGINFRHLTLIVIDEQHRFGVNQRSALRKKGSGVDLLAMTATPIPRTLALSIYGDIALSRIAHRPLAGAGLKTELLQSNNLDLAYGAVRDAVAVGQQAYVVCPLIDEADEGTNLDDVPLHVQTQTKPHSALATYQALQRGVFSDLNIGILTGRMSSAEKDEVMEKFRSGDLDVLVSTTVIEVGIDVPNATVMLIYNADRFGLATLHQLRGRVGRGSLPGKVFLNSDAKRGTPARRRLAALEATADGFKLAELDLKLRREGETLGYRQSGNATLKIADLYGDADIIEAAYKDARSLYRRDPELKEPQHRTMALEAQNRFSAYFEELGRI